MDGKTTEIRLVRHGETAWNREEIFRGRMDVELNETGLSQAEALASYLADRKLDAVYSSPLKRALRTAQAVGDSHGLEVIRKDDLLDFDFGEWHGMSVKQVQEKYPEPFAEWASSPETAKIPDGETLEEVRRRAMSVVAEVLDSRAASAVLVSHRVVNKVLICAMLGLDNSHFWNIRQDNCGITTFVHTGNGFVLTGHNDVSFLKFVARSELADF